MTAIPLKDAIERLAKAVEQAGTDDLREIFAELYPAKSLPDVSDANGPALAKELARHVRRWISGTWSSPPTATSTTTRKTRPCATTKASYGTRSSKESPASRMGVARAGHRSQALYRRHRPRTRHLDPRRPAAHGLSGGATAPLGPAAQCVDVRHRRTGCLLLRRLHRHRCGHGQFQEPPGHDQP